jgi:hypothetical protein
MGDWIDELKQRESDQKRQRAQQEAVMLRNDALIAARAPALWRTLADQLEADIRRLGEQFPDNPLMRLEVERTDDRITVSSAIRRRNFTATLIPAARIVGIEIRSRPDPLSAVESNRQEIRFTAIEDQVQMNFSGSQIPEKISEMLIRRLVLDHS